MKTNMTRRILVATFAMATLPFLAHSAPKAYTIGNNIGLGSYDPVSYFPEGGGAPKRGLIGNTLEHQGVVYRFASKDNMARFQKSPDKYVPAYNGWCAWALAALDKEVDIDPTSYVIRNGKLYLFYKDPEVDTRAMWNKDPEGLLPKAEANWKKRQ